MPLVDSADAAQDWRQDFFCEHLMDNDGIPKWEGVRGQRYVYARYFESDFEFLHDLERDPDQLQNLAGVEEQREILEQQRRRCDELREPLGGAYQAPAKSK